MHTKVNPAGTQSGVWPLTAFEHFMLADDKPDYPMCFWLRATLSGSVNAPRLNAALARTVTRHPLLGAGISGSPLAATASLSWRERPTVIYCDVAAAGEPLTFPLGVAAIDLSREPGLRVFVRQAGGVSTLLMQVHHAVCDGIAASQILDDILAFYDSEAGELARALVPGKLHGRGKFYLSSGAKWRRVAKDLWRILQFYNGGCQPIATATTAGSTIFPRAFSPASYPLSLNHELSAEELRTLKLGARQSGATVNDLLLRDAFLALDAWHIKLGKKRSLRIGMPVNMRLPLDLAMPAANLVSLCFLQRRGPLLADPAGLLRSLAKETRYIKDNYMGYALIAIATQFGKLRRGMEFLVTPRWHWPSASTLVLSNLGAPLLTSRLRRDAQGRLLSANLRLERLDVMPPVRRGSPVTIGAVTVNDRLSLTLHFDHKWIDQEQAQALFSGFTEALAVTLRDLVTKRRETLPFSELVEKHMRIRVGATALRSLAIGKNVAPSITHEHSQSATERLALGPARGTEGAKVP